MRGAGERGGSGTQREGRRGEGGSKAVPPGERRCRLPGSIPPPAKQGPAALLHCSAAPTPFPAAAQLPGCAGAGGSRSATPPLPTLGIPAGTGTHPPRLRARLLLPASPDRWTGPAPLAPPAHRPLVGNVWRDGTPATALPRLCRTLHLPVAATFISCPRSSHLPAPKPPLRPAPAALSLRPPPASPAASGTVGARMGAQGVPSPGFGLPGSSWALWPLCHCRPPSLLPSLCQQWMVMPDAEHQHSPSCCCHVAWGSGRQHVPAGTESTELGGTPALPKP